ncbi:MAG TPA: calcium-binding protein, partial [Solirubrobacteraceae bacterium]|nr:calcium-binding protein [Solirubrobacteraceae bacterium]
MRSRCPFRRTRRALLPLLVCLAPLVAAPTAGAAQIVLAGSQFSYQAAAGEQNQLRVYPYTSEYWVIDDPGAASISESGDGVCGDADANTTVCHMAGVTRSLVALHEGNDFAVVEHPSTMSVCAGAGHDVIGVFGAPTSSIAGGPGSDEMYGEAGRDIIYADDRGGCPAAGPPAPEDFDVMVGAGGGDILWGDSGAQGMVGGDGDDVLYAVDGNDLLSGGAGADVLIGGAGVDGLDGGADADVLNGGDGNDEVYGRDGNDDVGRRMIVVEDEGGPARVFDENGDDLLDGGPADDVLAGGPGDEAWLNALAQDQRRSPAIADDAGPNGADTLRGGDGNDRVTYAHRNTPLEVSGDGAPNDGAAGERDQVEGDVEQVVGGAARDRLTAGPGALTLDGGRGADELVG